MNNNMRKSTFRSNTTSSEQTIGKSEKAYNLEYSGRKYHFEKKTVGKCADASLIPLYQTFKYLVQYFVGFILIYEYIFHKS